VAVDNTVDRDGAPLRHCDGVDRSLSDHIRSATRQTFAPTVIQQKRQVDRWRWFAGRDSALLAWFESQLQGARPLEDDVSEVAATVDGAGPDERDTGRIAFDLAIESLWQVRFTSGKSRA
jgi:hypothetical protein